MTNYSALKKVFRYKVLALVFLKLFFLATLLITGCFNGEKRLVSKEGRLRQYAPDTNSQYFLADSLTTMGGGNDQLGEDSNVRKWASDVLFRLREPVLYNYFDEGEFVRLTWLRTFGNPVVVRVSNFNDTVYVSFKELMSKSSESDIPKVLKDTMTTLPLHRWRQILVVLEENDYWIASRQDTALGDKDGISWFLECRLPGKYHAIDRWDDGTLSSRDLNLFARELLDLAARYTTIKSLK